MSFVERVSALAQRAPSLVEHLGTEEATKNALVMPFIAALGYDVFNPREVVPEFTADVGLKRGEKVDYAIMRDDQVLMLFEAKKAGANLRDAERSQLYRYFSVTKARIAVLTNGTDYHFFSDLEEPNVMDELPFLKADLLDLSDNAVAALERLGKPHFDLERVLSQASELKFTSEIRRILATQVEEPEEEFVRFFFSRAVPDGRFVASAKEQWTLLVKKALQQFIADRVSTRLRVALEQEDVAAGRSPDPAEDASDGDEQEDGGKDGVLTTDDELEGFRIVRAIVRSTVDVDRVAHRDGKSYFAILLDDNNRKPLCRLHLNRSTWYISLFDADKNESKHRLEDLDSIYDHADALREAAQRYA